MKKIMLVFGTRPEAIKMIPVVKSLRVKSNSFEVKVCVTSQHKQMLSQVLDLFELKSDYDLDIMEESQDLYSITVKILTGMKKILQAYKPDLVLVHGDTTTAFVSALAAFYEKITVGHVEAGLRTYNKYSPYPEEINRQLICRMADYHFAPTQLNKSNLISEGVNGQAIYITGNTVIDALKWILSQFNEKKENEIKSKLLASGYKLSNRKILLVTGHRRENLGEGLESVCQALVIIAEAHPELDILYILHFNPKVYNPVTKALSGRANIYTIAPLEYESFVYLMSKADLIFTDSGGVQEEAACLNKPVLLMRDTTERVEALESGIVTMVGVDVSRICQEAEKFLKAYPNHEKSTKPVGIYGNGNASEKITNILMEIYNNA